MSLFDLPEVDKTTRAKKPKLGRYQRVMKLLQEEQDSYKVFVDFDDRRPSEKRFNFIDLFSGAGGMTLGFSDAGFEPVASVEVSSVASATHERNFPNCKHFCGNIVDFSPAEWLGDNRDSIQLVVGGPPCQGFSVAGRRDPDDPRNILFKEFVRVVGEVQPWYVVMENVPGILTMQGGRVRKAITESFAEIGYPNVSVAILEAAQFKVPQIRSRAIFIANRFDMVNPFPKAQLEPKSYLPIESAISDLPAYTPLPEINHEWTKHSKEFMERISKVPPGGSLYESYFDAFKRQYPGLPSMTIKENHGGTHIHPFLNRVISAREMARLQSFPDSFIFEGSMKKAMWQIGNAVPPRLAECIGLALAPYLTAIQQGTFATEGVRARERTARANRQTELL
ncbi:MAG TPA: DNA cytosine methyltransferase [Pyrinomonadaceae bacterium]|nr:DNA cytosine methyltransferase [Pyrinomonadaceae bacterium]